MEITSDIEDDAPSISGERAPKKVKGIRGILFSIMLKRIKFQPVKPD